MLFSIGNRQCFLRESIMATTPGFTLDNIGHLQVPQNH